MLDFLKIYNPNGNIMNSDDGGGAFNYLKLLIGHS